LTTDIAGLEVWVDRLEEKGEMVVVVRRAASGAAG
jgi:hypothetical protein